MNTDLENSTSNVETCLLISQQEAIGKADSLINVISHQQGRATRSESQRKVESVEVIHLLPERSSRTTNDSASINKALYLVNYENEGGFALLSSDKRLRPIYAVSDSGHIEMSDTIANKALALFFQNVRTDIQTAATNPSYYHNSGYKFLKNVQRSPYMWQKVRRWSQDDSPYNDSCFTATGEKALAGCAAISIAQIMSYYKHPGSYDGRNISWRAIKRGQSQYRLAWFIACLGQKQLLDVKYGTEESSALSNNYARTFVAMGYEKPKGFSAFKENDVRNALDKGPVLVLGSVGDASAKNLPGHSWVIDGYATEVENSTQNATLFHCVWGWGGKSNGYFYWSSNSINSNKPDSMDINDHYERYGTRGFTFVKLKYMANFKVK